MSVRSLHIDTARTWRGGQNQVLQLVTGLGERGDQPTLVAHEAGELRRRAEEGLRYIGFAPRSEFDVGAAFKLSKIIATAGPEVVHAHDPMGIALGAMALQMLPAAAAPRLFVAARRVDFHLKQHAFSRWKHRQIDVFIAASRVIGQILVQDGISPHAIEVVHDGVNIQAIAREPLVSVHAALGLPHGAPVVGNVAALAPHKGQKYLVAAAARVVRRIPDVRFVIVGAGELEGALERQIRDAGLDRHVHLAGFRRDAIGLLKSLDLFVTSSITEGLGSSTLEAMACGRAVVGTHAGGTPEVVDDGVTGLLVPPHDEAALAEAIATLVPDAPRRARFGAAGLARVTAEFSVEQMVDRTAAVYRRRLEEQR